MIISLSKKKGDAAFAWYGGNSLSFFYDYMGKTMVVYYAEKSSVIHRIVGCEYNKNLDVVFAWEETSDTEEQKE